MILTVVLLLFSSLWSGCAGNGKQTVAHGLKVGEQVPTWVLTRNTPNVPGAVCAVGIAGPTFYRFDAVETAYDAARSELAKILRVEIQSASMHIETTQGGLRDTQIHMEVASYVNDLVLEGSRILEVWYDESGAGFARKPNYTYALACIDETRVLASPAIR